MDGNYMGGCLCDHLSAVKVLKSGENRAVKAFIIITLNVCISSHKRPALL